MAEEKVESISEKIERLNREQQKIREEREARERRAKEKPLWKRILAICLSVVVGLGVIVGCYFAYLQMSYERTMDKKALEVFSSPVDKYVTVGSSYKAITYDLASGMFSPSFSSAFFKSTNADGKEVKGSSVKAASASDVEANLNGAITLVSSASYENTDFYFFQEVDVNSARSRNVDELAILQDSFKLYGAIMAQNYHTSFLFKPLFSPVGKINSGIATFTKYSLDTWLPERRKVPTETKLAGKYSRMDTCFTITRLKVRKVSGKPDDLVLVNVHFDETDDDELKASQLQVLYDYLTQEYTKNGSYVIVGGNFGSALATVNAESGAASASIGGVTSNFNTTSLAKIGFSFAVDTIGAFNGVGTYREQGRSYVRGESAEAVVDGFLVSANVGVIRVETINSGYAYSSHNPVCLEFVLN